MGEGNMRVIMGGVWIFPKGWARGNPYLAGNEFLVADVLVVEESALLSMAPGWIFCPDLEMRNRKF